MAQPPPYNPNPQAPSHFPQGYPGYPPQQPGYPQPTPGYAQENKGYPPQAGYPPQGYPAQPNYPPQGQGFIQQPMSSQMTSNNTTVVIAGQPSVTATVVPYVNDNMGLSIFACLCCCWIIGIFAIIKSSEAGNRYVAGDYAGAVDSAQTAKNLAISSIVCGLAIAVIVVILVASTS